MAELGYTNVRDYEGGKQDWIDAEFPTEGDGGQTAVAASSMNPSAASRPEDEEPSKPEVASTNSSTNPQKDVA